MHSIHCFTVFFTLSIDLFGLFSPYFSTLTVFKHPFTSLCEEAFSFSLLQVCKVHLFFGVIMADFSSFLILRNLWDDDVVGLEF